VTSKLAGTRFPAMPSMMVKAMWLFGQVVSHCTDCHAEQKRPRLSVSQAELVSTTDGRRCGARAGGSHLDVGVLARDPI